MAAGLSDRVTVEHTRIEELARGDLRESLDGVVARSFGPAAELAECALPLLTLGGSLVVSVSASTAQQWHRMPLAAALGCETSESWTTPHGRYLCVRRSGPLPERFPRSRAARKRSPLGQEAAGSDVSRET